MNDFGLYEMGALLRGQTFDGAKGMFVRFHADEPTGRGDETVSADSTSQVLQKFKAFSETKQVYPRRVHAEGIGWYTLGKTYDEAGSSAELTVSSGDAAETSRDKVVDGKIAVVTGGAQGFGEGMVRELVAAGAFAYIADLQIEKAQMLSQELNSTAGRTVSYPISVDVTNESSVETMYQEISLQTGGFDILISNAGVLKAGSVKEMSIKDFEFVTSVDYTGFFLCTKHAARLLALQNQPTGRYFSDIIVISSKSGLEGSNKNGAYAGAKFGTIGLTQSFALELIEDNIKVNALCPGNFLDGPLWSDPHRGLFVQYLNAGKVPGAETIADVRRFYEQKVPMKRGCMTEDVMKALFYVVEQNYETGQAIPVTGGQVMLH